ncbi:MAG: DUF4331 domain-containing protein [Labilithrix sp.]|nr:DUF4331 domain-containing protein [Labilithrix sp.]
MRMRIVRVALAVAALALATEAEASSHREAPFIAKMPKVDNTDFYMFRSYEAGRDQFVTIIANYQPLQDPYGGPNYFTMDSDALYEIHIDNNGDAAEDLTFQFRFQNALGGAGGAGIDIPVGGKMMNSPLVVGNAAGGGVTPFNLNTNRHVNETYGVKIVRGNRRTGTAADVTHVIGAGIPGATPVIFHKPIDFIGQKTFGDNGAVFAPNYNAYANAHVYDNVIVPGCAVAGTRVFVGQRREMFAVNLGAVFDLINVPLDATGLLEPNGGTANLYASGVGAKNVTTIALELPIACLRTSAAAPVIGGWATASVRQARVINPQATYAKPSREGGAWVQVSRLGSPLVNELLIGLKDKDRFNSSEPKDDAQFRDYLTHPTLPAIIELVFGSANAPAPKGTSFPRADLVDVFLEGIPNLNQPAAVKEAEMLRLNTAIAATPRVNQYRGQAGLAQGTAARGLGATGCFVDAATPTAKKALSVAGNLLSEGGTCDPAGFPNGRRPGDDVVDIALRLAMGYLLTSGDATTGNPDAAAGNLPLGDGVQQQPSDQFFEGFPYLPWPNPGAQTP